MFFFLKANPYIFTMRNAIKKGNSSQSKSVADLHQRNSIKLDQHLHFRTTEKRCIHTRFREKKQLHSYTLHLFFKEAASKCDTLHLPLFLFRLHCYSPSIPRKEKTSDTRNVKSPEKEVIQKHNKLFFLLKISGKLQF